VSSAVLPSELHRACSSSTRTSEQAQSSWIFVDYSSALKRDRVVYPIFFIPRAGHNKPGAHRDNYHRLRMPCQPRQPKLCSGTPHRRDAIFRRAVKGVSHKAISETSQSCTPDISYSCFFCRRPLLVKMSSSSPWQTTTPSTQSPANISTLPLSPPTTVGR
jgi:hypothetical protein